MKLQHHIRIRALGLSCLVAALVATAATLDTAEAAKRSKPVTAFEPNHLFVGAQDTVTNSATVFEFDGSGTFVRKIPVTSGDGSAINALEFGPDGRLYACVIQWEPAPPSGSNVEGVYEIEGSLSVRRPIQTEFPGGMTFGPGGLVYVGDYATGTLRAHDLEGGVPFAYDPKSQGGTFSFVNDIEIGASGHAYVSVTNNAGFSGIHELDADLRFVRAIGAGAFVGDPTGPVFLGDGTLLFADYTGDRLVRLGPDGEPLGVLATSGLAGPWRPTLGPDGRLYVANFLGDDVSVLEAATGQTVRTITHPEMILCVSAAFAPFRMDVRPKGEVLAAERDAQKLSERGAVLSFSLGSGTTFLTVPSAGSGQGLGGAFPQLSALVFNGPSVLAPGAQAALIQGTTSAPAATDGAQGALSLSVRGKPDANGFFVPKKVSGTFQIGRPTAAAYGGFKTKKPAR